MSRRIEHSASYSSSPAAVHAAVTDVAYWRARIAAVGGRRATVDSADVADGGIVIRVTQTISADYLPSVVRKIRSGDLAVQRTETWGALDGTSASGTFAAIVAGSPIKMRGTHSLSGDDESCTSLSTGDAYVSVPLIGGKIEQIIAEHLGELLIIEQRFTEQWLAEH
jgi:Protein of unknown function (DUF2505)